MNMKNQSDKSMKASAWHMQIIKIRQFGDEQVIKSKKYIKSGEINKKIEN